MGFQKAQHFRGIPEDLRNVSVRFQDRFHRVVLNSKIVQTTSEGSRCVSGNFKAFLNVSGNFKGFSLALQGVFPEVSGNFKFFMVFQEVFGYFRGFQRRFKGPQID